QRGILRLLETVQRLRDGLSPRSGMPREREQRPNLLRILDASDRADDGGPGILVDVVVALEEEPQRIGAAPCPLRIEDGKRLGAERRPRGGRRARRRLDDE